MTKQKPHTIQPEEIDAALDWLRENGPARAENIAKSIGRSSGGMRGVMNLDQRFYMIRSNDGMLFNAVPKQGEYTVVLPGHGWGLTGIGFAHHHKAKAG